MSMEAPATEEGRRQERARQDSIDRQFVDSETTTDENIDTTVHGIVKSCKDRKTGSTYYGDFDFADDFSEDNFDELIADTTWSEVFTACFIHTPFGWGMIALSFFLCCVFLYFFLLALELISTSAKILGGCTAGSLFGDDVNPLTGVMIGILATVMMQSSSTTTSVIVSLVGSGSIMVGPAVYLVMGANIGTTVTNTIVAIVGSNKIGAHAAATTEQLERAFAGATLHDVFNGLCVAVLLPLEVATGYLVAIASSLTRNVATEDDEHGVQWEGPIRQMVSPLRRKILIANKDVIADIANGRSENCGSYYPVICENNIMDYNHCVIQGRVGLVTCDEKSGECPAFFRGNGATVQDDRASGSFGLVLGLVILLLCLVGVVTILKRLLMGISTRIVYKTTNMNGYIAMAVGAGVTVLVQSSSITTSVLTPLVGMNVIKLEQMLPLTLGANVGTTITALTAAMVSEKIESLQIAVAHVVFNVTGILIWYPLPFLRRIPLSIAMGLGRETRRRGLVFPVLYVVTAFVVLPSVLLGLAFLV